ncbi:hypothetical protein ANRL3_00423 [Anaerolineae bacterium]|nr:hypothetical protein ANRL3_00423 [Anaerolineae bacterium]
MQMKSPSPSLFPPPGRHAQFRLKQFNFDLDNVVGWSEFHVLLKLGLPDEKRAGAEWQTNPPSHNIIIRDSAGKPMKGFSFEPVPHTIPPLQPYETWFYHNVRGMTWRLYLTRTSRIPIVKWFLPRVVEVYAHPTNAVF